MRKNIKMLTNLFLLRQNRNKTMTQKEIQKKLQAISDLFHMAYEIKKEQLRKKFPNKSEKELNHMAYALIEKGCR